MSVLAYEALVAEPQLAPAVWLASQSHVDLPWFGGSLVLLQPSSTLIVYAFGLLTVVLGLSAFRGQNDRARRLFGAALVWWGVGALLAGSSYQAFGYVLKGQGRALVAYTDAFELAYLACSAVSIATFGLAVARASLVGLARRLLRAWSWASLAGYLAALATGAVVGDRFLVSFEAMVLITTPSFLVYFAVAVVRWRRTRSSAEARLAWAWVGLALAMAAYAAAAAFGLGAALWRSGVWFTENDVLHLALAVWMVYLAFGVAPKLATRA